MSCLLETSGESQEGGGTGGQEWASLAKKVEEPFRLRETPLPTRVRERPTEQHQDPRASVSSSLHADVEWAADVRGSDGNARNLNRTSSTYSVVGGGAGTSAAGIVSGTRRAKLGDTKADRGLHCFWSCSPTLLSCGGPTLCPAMPPEVAPVHQSMERLCGGESPTSTCSWPWRATASSSDSPTQPYSSGVKTVVGTWKVGLESDMLFVCRPRIPLCSQIETVSLE